LSKHRVGQAHYIGVSVLAASAAVEDALSTALYVTAPSRTANFPGVSARLTRPDGAVEQLSS
jgi:FAD:protein FMN transferase